MFFNKKNKRQYIEVEIPQGYDSFTAELITNEKGKFTQIKIMLYEKES